MERIRLEEFLDYRFLSDLRLSPEGRKAAFAVSRSNEERDGYDTGIWVADLEDGSLRQLTRGKDERDPRWLDEDRLLFVSGRDKQKKYPQAEAYETDFYEISLRGGEACRRFRIHLPVKAAEEIGGGKWLLLAEYDTGLPEGFYEKAEEEREALLQERKAEADCSVFTELPFWHNGKGITNGKRNRLYLFQEETGSFRPLTAEDRQVEHYALSRDKGHVLVICSSWEQGQQSLKHSLSELSLPEGGEEILVPLERYELRNAGYAGERILVQGTENLSYGVNENSAVYEYDRQQGALRKLFAPDCALENSVGSDCRLGGGRSLVFTEDGFISIVTERNSSKLVHFELDGKRTDLTKDEGSVDCMDLQKGTLLYVAMRDGKLQELYRLTEQGETCLTDFNGKVLEGKYVAKPRFLSFTNRDGVEIDGFVLEPVDYDPEKRYPAILDIHGGPKTVYGDCFYHEMQYWANEGYFVFFCNPRGGDGRGDAFADIRGRYGKEDYQDIMEFTDQVLKAYPQIDPARLGVTGGSYGGFMTNWIIGNTDRFAAAASQRSIANWISMEGTSDIGPFFGEDQSGGNAWRHPEMAWECSPLKYADHCKTPTLFIHSDEDYRCWMVEAFQMFSALKLHGVESRICLFHGENHELSRSGKPKNRIRRLREITEWMGRYL